MICHLGIVLHLWKLGFSAIFVLVTLEINVYFPVRVVVIIVLDPDVCLLP